MRNLPRLHPAGVVLTTITQQDLLAFLLIIRLLARSSLYRTRTTSLFKIVVQDATHYFLVIFTSHFIFEMTLLFGRVRILSWCFAASRVTETILALNPTAPWHVSYIGTHLLCLFTRPLSTQQRKHRVRLNVFFPASPLDLNHTY